MVSPPEVCPLRERRSYPWYLFVSVVAVLMCGWVVWQVAAIDRKVPPLQIEQPRQKPEERPTMLQATWTDADGITHTVQTTQNPGEDDAAWAARHIAAVNALKAAFPPG